MLGQRKNWLHVLRTCVEDFLYLSSVRISTCILHLYLFKYVVLQEIVGFIGGGSDGMNSYYEYELDWASVEYLCPG